MKKVLIVKMSSMGDVIHTLPALTDVLQQFPDVTFDWVVEPAFAEIPKWHRAVNKVIEAPLRHWRQDPYATFKQGQWHEFIRKLRYTSYDAVIDAQGLIKSALVARFAKGRCYGFNRNSAKEGLASFSYHKTFNVPKQQHAVERIRQLFAQIFDYPLSKNPPDYGINKSRLQDLSFGENSILFLHGTTWDTKHWPVSYWQQLGLLASNAGYQVLLPWGNETEQQRANAIRDYCQEKVTKVPQVLPKLSIAQVTSLIAKAKGIVAVDTGLGHIAAAMGTKTLSLYGPTDPALTGAYGPNQFYLVSSLSCAPCLARTCKIENDANIKPPCFEGLTPQKVWERLLKEMTT